MRKRISPPVAAVLAAMLATPTFAATTAGTNGSTVTAVAVAPAPTSNSTTTNTTTFSSSSMSLSAPPPASPATSSQASSAPTSSNPVTTTQTSSLPTPSNSSSAVLSGPRDTTSGTVSGQATPGGPASTAVAEGVQANTTTEENATNANVTAAANTTGELAPLGGTGSNTGTTNATTGIAGNGVVLADTLASGGVTADAFTVGPNGERIPVNAASNANIVAANTITPTPEINAATRRVANETHRKVARNEQLMHSIAPRTDVDRTSQMPDDPSPLFSR